MKRIAIGLIILLTVISLNILYGMTHGLSISPTEKGWLTGNALSTVQDSFVRTGEALVIADVSLDYP